MCVSGEVLDIRDTDRILALTSPQKPASRAGSREGGRARPGGAATDPFSASTFPFSAPDRATAGAAAGGLAGFPADPFASAGGSFSSATTPRPPHPHPSQAPSQAQPRTALQTPTASAAMAIPLQSNPNPPRPPPQFISANRPVGPAAKKDPFADLVTFKS